MKFTLTDTGAANLTNAFRGVLQVPLNAALKNKELEYKQSNDQFANRLKTAQTGKAYAETAGINQMNSARGDARAMIDAPDWDPENTKTLSRLAVLTSLGNKSGKGILPFGESKKLTGATINGLTGTFHGPGADAFQRLSDKFAGADKAYEDAALANLLNGKGGLSRLARGDHGVAYDEYDGGKGVIYDSAGHGAYVKKTRAEATRAAQQGLAALRRAAAAQQTADAAMIRANKYQPSSGGGGKNSTVTFYHVGAGAKGVKQTNSGLGFQTETTKGEKVLTGTGLNPYFQTTEVIDDPFAGKKTKIVTDKRAVEAANLWFAENGLPATPRNVALYKKHSEAGDLFDFLQESRDGVAPPAAPASNLDRALTGTAPAPAEAPAPESAPATAEVPAPEPAPTPAPAPAEAPAPEPAPKPVPMPKSGLEKALAGTSPAEEASAPATDATQSAAPSKPAAAPVNPYANASLFGDLAKAGGAVPDATSAQLLASAMRNARKATPVPGVAIGADGKYVINSNADLLNLVKAGKLSAEQAMKASQDYNLK